MDIQALAKLGQTCQGDRKLWRKTLQTFQAEVDAAMKVDEDTTHVDELDATLARELDRIQALIAAKSWEPAFDAWEGFLRAWTGAQVLMINMSFVPLLRSAARAYNMSAKLALVRSAQIDYLSVHVVGLQKKRKTRGNPF